MAATYVLLAVESPAQASWLVEDIRAHPLEALESPHWHNKIRAQVAGVFDRPPVTLADAPELAPCRDPYLRGGVA